MKSPEERQAHIVERAEQRFLRGEDHFPARGFLDTFGMHIASENLNEDLHQSNVAIIEMLRGHGAEAEIYTIREDLGSGLTDTQPDYVRVAEREGKFTGMVRRIGEAVIIRASTAPQPTPEH